MSARPLQGKVAIVTGASRGIGQGIAVQLGEAGATVYITGRKPAESDAASYHQPLPSLEETAKEINARGGVGIAKYVDHADQTQVKAFFDEVEKEQSGKLDILVNNAYAAVATLFGNNHKSFFELEPEIWDTVNNVGLRNHYFCSVYGARIMVKNKSGLIVNVSSVGGKQYLFNVAYGVGKAAVDRLAADTAVELKAHGVTAISLYPGPVRTQIIQGLLDTSKGFANTDSGKRFAEGETIEYSGKAVVALASDDKILEKTGKILRTVDLGDEYGFVDIDGRKPPNLAPASYQSAKK